MNEIRRYKLLGYNSYLIMGMLLTAVSSAMPAIRAEYGFSYESAGLIFSLGALGFFIGSVFGGFFIELLGTKKTNFIGLLIIPVGIFLFIFSKMDLSMAFSNMIIGIGTGTLESGIPPVCSKFKGNTGKILNLMHAFFALGAVVSPLIISFFIGIDISWKIILLMIIGYLAIPVIANFSLADFKPGMQKTEKKSHKFSFLKLFFFWAICAGVFLYVSSELGTSSWSPLFASDILKTKDSLSGILPSLFWAGLFVGRVVSSYFVDKFGASKWLLIVSLSGLPIVFFAQNPIHNFTFLSIFVVASGLIHSSIYPTLQSILVERVSKGIGFAVGIFAAFGAIGGSAAGFFIGGISENWGIKTGYFSAFYFFLGTVLTVFLLYFSERKKINNVKIGRERI